jgi:hypothetical protein
MTKFQVTLNFSFNGHSADDDYGNDKQMRKRRDAFQRTDEHYREHNIVEYIKSFDAMGLVEYVMCDGEVLSAEWDPETFQIHMVVESELNEEEVKDDLEMNSLEDGEYEACGETGWLIFTRGPNGEVFDDPMGSEDFWEYGLLDYRQNTIQVKNLVEVV